MIPKGKSLSVVKTGFEILEQMKEFYRDFPDDVMEILEFEEEKLRIPEKRYAWMIKEQFEDDFAGHSVDHPNGWGIAIFCGKEVNIEKEPVAAYKSSYLKERLRTPLRASNMMAHIRFATRGHMAYENCHPFIKHDQTGRAWTFMHNGTIFSCPLLSKYLYAQSGQTDSERILLYMIDQINAETEKQGRTTQPPPVFETVEMSYSALNEYKMHIIHFSTSAHTPVRTLFSLKILSIVQFTIFYAQHAFFMHFKRLSKVAHTKTSLRKKYS